MDKYSVLRNYFGHDSFRPGQEAIIDALTAGRDVLAVMPTGSGKSLCYQIPAILKPGLTIVISPLIALMRDQVGALAKARVACAYINSTLTDRQITAILDDASNGLYKLLYVAPERLANPLFHRYLSERAAQLFHNKTLKISMVIVDEAHCISMWGSAFRPNYRKIDEFVNSLPERPVVGAFTATATRAVADDIEKLLALQDPMHVTTGFDRPNLYFDVRMPDDKLPLLATLLRKRRDQCGIVYCSTRAAVEEIHESLLHLGIYCTYYHGGMSSEERDEAQRAWLSDSARIIIATNAFGMGIDKPDVRFVIHYNMPLNIEGYYQEAGRAGRDGKKSDCILLFSEADISVCKWLIGHSTYGSKLNAEQRAEYRERELQKLQQMVDYCRTSKCLRHTILDYFGEDSQEKCNNCCNCLRSKLLSQFFAN